jgi:hypothetical protein
MRAIRPGSKITVRLAGGRYVRGVVLERMITTGPVKIKFQVGDLVVTASESLFRQSLLKK